MHDVRAIRDEPDAFVRGWSSRGVEDAAGVVQRVLKADIDLRSVQTVLQAAQSRRNDLSKLIGMAKGRKDEAEAQRLMAEVETLKGDIANGFDAERSQGQHLRDLLATLPNLPADDVPEGADEHGNVEVNSPTFDTSNLGGWRIALAGGTPKDHADLGEALGLMDFEAASRMSGARFVALKGGLARLSRALGQFMLDLHTEEHGYTEVQPPLLVRDEAMFGTGQLPKFEEDLFSTGLTAAEYTEDASYADRLLMLAGRRRWLIPTAEVSLTNLVREEITPEEQLPLRMTALTPCFRAEAGSAGRDTRGMIRQHQFDKVELVSITAPEDSAAEHERMTACAETVLTRLGLPFRTMLLCTGDMGFSARKTWDIEVWLPSAGAYREISSCSNCGDFQARRMDARIRKAGEKGGRFAHTPNGSGTAVGRALVAVMENYQDEGGRIAVPDVLKPYMGSMTHVERAA